jgi:hypothetical protein
MRYVMFSTVRFEGALSKGSNGKRLAGRWMTLDQNE